MNGTSSVASPVRRAPRRRSGGWRHSTAPARVHGQTAALGPRVRSDSCPRRLPLPRADALCRRFPVRGPRTVAIPTACPIPRSAGAGTLRRLQVTIDHGSVGREAKHRIPCPRTDPSRAPDGGTDGTGTPGTGRVLGTVGVRRVTRSPTGRGRLASGRARRVYAAGAPRWKGEDLQFARRTGLRLAPRPCRR